MSALAMRRFDSLISGTPPPIHDEVIVLACPPGEQHTLPLLYLNLMLRRRSWNVVLLGGDVPEEHLEETSRSANAALVVMSAQRLADRGCAQECRWRTSREGHPGRLWRADIQSDT